VAITQARTAASVRRNRNLLHWAQSRSCWLLYLMVATLILGPASPASPAAARSDGGDTGQVATAPNRELPASAGSGSPAGEVTFPPDKTPFSIREPSFLRYFNERGGLDTFGYPVSNVFRFRGFSTQIFQRRVMQLSEQGQARLLNLLDPELLPYRRFGGSHFPAHDAALAASAPPLDDPAYSDAVVDFVRENAPDEFQGQAVRFFDTFSRTVTCDMAFPEGGCNQALLPLLNLEMWGVPTSAPEIDPDNSNFIYQRFQRGIMHYDADCACTQAILLGNYFKEILTNQGLPDDLADDASGSPLLGAAACGLSDSDFTGSGLVEPCNTACFLTNPTVNPVEVAGAQSGPAQVSGPAGIQQIGAGGASGGRGGGRAGGGGGDHLATPTPTAPTSTATATTTPTPNQAVTPTSTLPPVSIVPVLPSASRITRDASGQKLVKDEIILVLSAQVASPDARAQQLATSSGGTLLGGIEQTRTYQVVYQAEDLRTLENIRSSLEKVPDVTAAVFHYLTDTAVTRIPDDPIYTSRDKQFGLRDTWNQLVPETQWHWVAANAAAGWDVSGGDPAVRVAIIDVDFDVSHEDLTANIRSFSGPATRDIGHGTHVAGLACGDGNNGIGVTGATWRCSLGLFDYGSPVNSPIDPMLVAQAMVQAALDGSRVVNMSLQFIDNNECGTPGDSSTLARVAAVNAVLAPPIQFAQRHESRCAVDLCGGK
jgi:hypothetical protein